MKPAKLARLVDAEIARRRLFDSQTPTFRTMTIDFVGRAVTFDGRTVKIQADFVSIPILISERPLLPQLVR